MSVAMALALVLLSSPAQSAEVAAPPRSDRAPATFVMAPGADVAGSQHVGILARELARQAVMMAARDELGLVTRDMTLREIEVAVEKPKFFSKKSATPAKPAGTTFEAGIKFSRSGDVTIDVYCTKDGRRQSIAHAKKGFNWSQTIDYVELAAWCESLAHDSFADAIRKALDLPDAKAAKKSDATGKAKVATEIEPLLSRMTCPAQFAAIRQLHELHSAQGAAAPLGDIGVGLVRGYANLGALTEAYWSPAHLMFKARSLLYASRAARQSPNDVAARRALGYALALAGLPDAALPRLAAGDASAAPAWCVIAVDFCRFDNVALDRRAAAAAQEKDSVAELARFCEFIVLEPTIDATETRYAADTARQKRFQDFATELPDCWRVRMAVGRHGYQAPEHLFTPAWYADLAKVPALTDSAKKTAAAQAGHEANKTAEELASRAALIRNLRTGRDADRGEPSLATLATLVEEASFVTALTGAQWATAGAERSEAKRVIDEFKTTVLPTIERHPAKAIVERWLNATGYVSPDIDSMLKQLDPANPMPGELEIVGMSADSQINVPAEHHNVPAILAHTDDNYAGMLLRWRNRGELHQTHPIRNLYSVSSQAPIVVSEMIVHDWPTVQAKAAEFEQRYASDVGVLVALAAKYGQDHKPADARRVLEAIVKMAPSEWAYTRLADSYKQQGDLKHWLSTLEDFIRKNDSFEERGRVQILIARHFLQTGDYAQALRYAQASGGVDSGEAQKVIAQCHEFRKEYGAAERAYREMASDRNYRPDAMLWHRFCHATGHGNLNLARDAVHDLIEANSDEAIAPDLAVYLAVYSLLENSPTDALKWFQQSLKVDPILEDGSPKHYDDSPEFEEAPQSDKADKSDKTKPGAEQPGAEKPGAEKPGTEKLGTEKLGTEKLGTEKPATEKPAEQPAEEAADDAQPDEKSPPDEPAEKPSEEALSPHKKAVAAAENAGAAAVVVDKPGAEDAIDIFEEQADDAAIGFRSIARFDPYTHLHIALIAQQMKNTRLREQSLDAIAGNAKKIDELFGDSRRSLMAAFALLEPALRSADAKKFDRAALDRSLEKSSPEDRADVCYFVGRTLDLLGAPTDAQPYFTRAAATPTIRAARSLSAVWLRAHGVEPNELAPLAGK